MRHFLILTFFLLILSEEALSQSNVITPAEFHQFFRTYTLINPASMGIQNDNSIITGEKSLIGEFKGVRTFYTNLFYNISRKSQRKNMLGATFINDKEGTYINHSEASFSYAIHIPIHSNFTLSGGASMGFINYAILSTNIAGGGSAFAPRGDVGAWLYNEKFNLGLSVNQLVAGSLQPTNTVYPIKKYLNLNIDKTFTFNPNYSLMPALALTWINHENYYLNMAALVSYKKFITGGIGTRYKRGLYFYWGLEKVKINDLTFRMMISYFDTFNKGNLYDVQSMEISLNLLLPDKNKNQIKIREEE